MVCVEEKGGGNGLSVHERAIPRNRITKIIVMVHGENDNSSDYLFSFGIAEHFPSITYNIIRQPARVTVMVMLYATLHTTGFCIRSLHHRYLYPHLHLVCTYFLYWDNLLSLLNLAYFSSHYKCFWANS